MKIFLNHIKFLLFILGILCFQFETAAQKVIVVKVDGAINPVVSDYIHNGIEKAREEQAQALLIELNTPGGLLKSTRIIVADMLAAPVPVIVYVSPEGAHAGSAGVFITMASHAAAMAPTTNIGAAHPVSMQGGMDSVMGGKVTNDAAAFIRSIAGKRNRNLEWAEEAVRYSVSITAQEALKRNVIDLIADDKKDLLRQIDGQIIQLNEGSHTMKSADAKLELYEMNAWEKILNAISDPNIAYILMMIGIYGIMFELMSPGTMVPGIIGFISLVLAFYAMHTLPVNYAGLALLIFGIILFILEIKIVSHGLLAIGGAVAVLLGSLMLVRASSPLELANISKGIIFTSTIITTLFFMFIVGLGLKAQRRKVLTGVEGLSGSMGESIDDLKPFGTVLVQGEVWNGESISGFIDKGEKIRVKEMKDLKLYVEKFSV